MGRMTPGSRTSAIGMLQAISLALFAIFLVSVILRALPPRLLDPLWQISLSTVLLDMGGYALLGVVVLTVAQLLQPGDERLHRLHIRITRLCGIASFGYLLLIPLLLSALLLGHQKMERESQRKLSDIGKMEQRLQEVIRSAPSRPELLRVVQRINAPALADFLMSDEPLERQRAQAMELLRNTATTARLQVSVVNPVGLQSMLLNNLRLLLLSLVFAFGFASAEAGLPSFPLLEPLRRGLDRFRRMRRSIHRREHGMPHFFARLLNRSRRKPNP